MWHVQSSCATTGDGLVEGLSWLAEAVRNPGKRIPPQEPPLRRTLSLPIPSPSSDRESDAILTRRSKSPTDHSAM